MAFDEKIVRASTSQNLRHLERSCDVDMLGASGMVKVEVFTLGEQS